MPPDLVSLIIEYIPKPIYIKIYQCSTQLNGELTDIKCTYTISYLSHKTYEVLDEYEKTVKYQIKSTKLLHKFLKNNIISRLGNYIYVFYHAHIKNKDGVEIINYLNSDRKDSDTLDQLLHDCISYATDITC